MVVRIAAAAAAMFVLASAAISATPEKSLPPGPGRDLVAKNCAGCHMLSVVTATPRTAAGWSTVVDQMIAQGAAVGDDEKPAIIAYLTKNFPAGAKAAVPAATGKRRATK